MYFVEDATVGTIREDFQRAISQSQQGKGVASGFNRKAYFTSVNFTKPSQEEITAVSEYLIGKTYSIKSNTFQVSSPITAVSYSNRKWYVEFSEMSPPIVAHSGLYLRKLILDGQIPTTMGTTFITEDFQRAIAQSQKGKTSGGSIKRGDFVPGVIYSRPEFQELSPPDGTIIAEGSVDYLISVSAFYPSKGNLFLQILNVYRYTSNLNKYHTSIVGVYNLQANSEFKKTIGDTPDPVPTQKYDFTIDRLQQPGGKALLLKVLQHFHPDVDFSNRLFFWNNRDKDFWLMV